MEETKEDLERQVQELLDAGVHHAKKEVVELKAKIKALEESGEGQEETVAAASAVQSKESPAKKENVKEGTFSINPNSTYVFKTSKDYSRWVFPSECKAYDESAGIIRTIRYCKTADSPFLDQQHETDSVERTPIVFSKIGSAGKASLAVSGKNPALIRYLMATDHFKKGLITIDDPQKKAKDELEAARVKNKAKNIILESSPEQIEMFGASVVNTLGLSVEQVTVVLLDRVEASISLAHKVVSDFTNPEHAVRFAVLEAVQKGKIGVDHANGKITNTATGALLTTYDSSKKHYLDHVSALIQSKSPGYEGLAQIIGSK